MDKKFDQRIATKIRSSLLEYEEPYEVGAWEKFQALHKRSKKHLIAWLGASIAASIFFALLLGSLYDLIWVPVPNIPIVNDGPTGEQGENPDQKEAIGTENYTTPSPPNFEKLALREAPSSVVNSSEKTISHTMINEMLEISVKEPGRADEVIELDKENEKIKSDELVEHYQDPLFQDNLVDKKEKGELLFGVILASGAGVSYNDPDIAGSMSYNGGVSFELPVSKRFSISSGLAMNYMSIQQETRTFVGDLSNPDIRDDDLKTEQLNLGVPIQIVYSLDDRKENLFASLGVTSYYSLKQQTSISSTVTREVEMFSGGGDPIVVTETLESSETIQGEANQFLPVATLDVALSYRINRSGGVTYELCPFYRHPISSLTGDGTKVPLGGVAIKLLFTSRDR